MPRYGGTRLAGRRYFLGARPVEVRAGWGPDAKVRNVRIAYLDTADPDAPSNQVVRPFRGLTLAPRGPGIRRPENG